MKPIVIALLFMVVASCSTFNDVPNHFKRGEVIFFNSEYYIVKSYDSEYDEYKLRKACCYDPPCARFYADGKKLRKYAKKGTKIQNEYLKSKDKKI